MKQDHRITLISGHPLFRARHWDRRKCADGGLMLLQSFAVLRDVIAGFLGKGDADVERIILDRSSSSSDYLSLLAELPIEFAGDVLMIRDDESGFLSSMGRGGDRILYALCPSDIQFYLETQRLIFPGEAMPAAVAPPAVLQFRPRAATA